MNPRTLLRHLPTLALLGAAAYACHASRDARAARTENARLRTEAAQARLREAGYQTVLATVGRSALRARLEAEHWRALAEEPDVEPVAYVEATVEARGEVEGEAHIVAPDSVPVPAIPDSVAFRGMVDDGLLQAAWLLWPARRLFRMDYRVHPPIELVVSRFADGSLAVSAESPDPRVRVDVDDFVWSPPEIGGCGWGCKLKWLAGGALAGAFAWEMVR